MTLPRQTVSRRNLTAICGLTAVTIAVGVALPGNLINLFWNYTLAGGSFFGKFHPASYIASLLLFLIVFDSGKSAPALDRRLLTLLGVFGILVAWLGLCGKGAFASTVVDIYIAPIVVLLALTRLESRHVRAIMVMFVAIAALNAILVIFEFGSRIHVAPYIWSELYFRPCGLFSHPISAGLLFCCAQLLIRAGVVNKQYQLPISIFLLAAVALCGARSALFMSTLIVVVETMYPRTARSLLGIPQHLLLLVLLPCAIIGAYASGAFDRVLALGIWEESAQSRFFIFDAFDYLSPAQLWNEVEGYDTMGLLTHGTTGGEFIESFFVLATFQAGLPFGLMLSASIVAFVWPWLRSNSLFAILTTLTAFMTLAFAAKNPLVMGLALTGFYLYEARSGKLLIVGRSTRFNRLSPPRHRLAHEGKRGRLFIAQNRRSIIITKTVPVCRYE